MKREAILAWRMRLAARRDDDELTVEPFEPVGEPVRAGVEAEAARIHASGVRWG